MKCTLNGYTSHHGNHEAPCHCRCLTSHDARLYEVGASVCTRVLGWDSKCGPFLSVLTSLWCVVPTGGLFPTGSHEYEVFRFALARHQDAPKLVPQVDMVDTGSSFAMTYACKFT